MLPPIGQRDTICLTVVDRHGNACSLVNSLFDAFGCGKICPRTGIILQSRGAGFRVELATAIRFRAASDRFTPLFLEWLSKTVRHCYPSALWAARISL